MRTMTFEAFKEEYLDAIIRGVDMLCVWWTEDDQQFNMCWHPYTADMHSQVVYEAEMLLEEKGITEDDDEYDDAFDEAVCEVMDAYADVLSEAAYKEYEKYLEMLGEDEDDDEDE